MANEKQNAMMEEISHRQANKRIATTSLLVTGTTVQQILNRFHQVASRSAQVFVAGKTRHDCQASCRVLMALDNPKMGCVVICHPGNGSDINGPYTNRTLYKGDWAQHPKDADGGLADGKGAN